MTAFTKSTVDYRAGESFQEGNAVSWGESVVGVVEDAANKRTAKKRAALTQLPFRIFITLPQANQQILDDLFPADEGRGNPRP